MRYNMDKGEFFNILKKELSSRYNIDEKNIDYKTKIQDDIIIDSLGITELSVYIEEIFDVFITDDELYNCKTVEDMVDLIYKKMEKNNGK
jgi:acyl carrier protein